ncbi:MAG: hypothetical protein KF833_06120 [Verrucomicrobiae bacterium]|nr:hypothetical protein [Verrucomicrobiae bacterium]
MTRMDTDVRIEARRSVHGPVLASYRMGSSSGMGEFHYQLRIPMGDRQAAATPDTAQPGDVVVILVRNAAGLQHQVSHQIVEPGAALRFDFGASLDTDGDGVPDGWELAQLGGVKGSLEGDTDGDGVSDLQEYVAGTRPTDAADVFRLATMIEGGLAHISFRALSAQGSGYEGRRRWYALESSTAMEPDRWQAVENHSRIPGMDQIVVYSRGLNGTDSAAFFRARVWLEGP